MARKYDMSRRAAAAAKTRRRIVEATLALHGEQGIAATSWDQIAARAGVGVGTVYRHFPSLDELVPACGDVALEALDLPDPAAAGARFAGARGRRARMERLAGEAFALYERAAPAVRAIRREAGVHPRVAEDRDRVDAALDALVDAALEPLEAGERERAVARALVDLGTWEALRGQGLDADAAVAEAAALLAHRVR